MLTESVCMQGGHRAPPDRGALRAPVRPLAQPPSPSLAWPHADPVVGGGVLPAAVGGGPSAGASRQPAAARRRRQATRALCLRH